MTVDPPAPDVPSAKGKAGQRVRAKGLWLVLSGAVGVLLGLAALVAGLVPSLEEAGGVAGVFAALCFSHLIFFEVLFDAHAKGTRRAKLVRNLIWSVVYVLIFVALYACLFSLGGVMKNGEIIKGEFLPSLFLSVITWTTVGYGDVTPAGGLSQFAAGIEAMNGYLVMAVFIAALVRTFERLAADAQD